MSEKLLHSDHPERTRSASVSETSGYHIIEEAKIDESYLFRHAEQFKWLRDTWLPKLLTHRRESGDASPIRILSAGCSTGEEVYSLSALCKEALKNHAEFSYEILGVDINPKSIEKARSGIYSQWSIRQGVERPYQKWFHLGPKSVSVDGALMEHVRFCHSNLLEMEQQCGVYPNSFDLILCRNVMIYFHQQGYDKLFALLNRVLKPSGILLTGPSDPMPQQTTRLAGQWVSGTHFYRPIRGEKSAQFMISKKQKERTDQVNSKRSVISDQPEGRSKRTDVDRITQQPKSTGRNTLSDADIAFERLRAKTEAMNSFETVQHIDRFLEQFSDHVPGQLYKAWVCLDLKLSDLALKTAKHAAETENEAIYPKIVLALALFNSGELEEAGRLLEESLVLLEASRLGADELPEHSSELTVSQLKQIIDVYRKQLV